MKEAGVNYNKGQLGQMAKQYGFVRDTFEKVLRLKEILTYLNADEYLHEHLALKGGTAINMTIFNLPRLSVDLDLDFTPNLPLEDMEKAREKITKMLERYMTEEGYFLSGSSRYSHSLDSMLFQYQNAGGNRDNIKVELNYSLRSHIFAPVERKIVTDIFEEDVMVRTLEPVEIFAAKANALMSRAAARDLMDWNFLRSGVICFRCFVIEELMVLTGEEKEYLDMFEKGEYMPSLLFSDNQILENIVEHPIAIWKVQSTQKIEIKL